MTNQMRVLVFGMMGQTPFAGVAWQVLHYLEGLRRLGHDVYYIEDTGTWPYDPEQNTITDDVRYAVNYIGQLMSWCGMQDHWAYLSAAAGGNAFGPSAGRVSDLLRHSDVLINLTGSTLLREEHLAVPVRIYLETDPVLPQIEIAQGRKFTISLLEAHTHHFTYGENLGAQDCGVPLTRFHYRPTRPPVVLEWWERRTIMERPFYTTIASWKQSGKDIVWNGETYTWSKHHEFLKFLDLPAGAGPFELALACDDPEVLSLLRRHRWCVTDAIKLSRDISTYRNYIIRSRAEFTVAKDQNIRLRSGWFSDRSACYLAASRPVVTQDTGFGKVLPVGEGLFAFCTMEEASAAFREIESDYARHARRAHCIAEEYFRAERVLNKLFEEAGM
jgi:hypothetical protein